LTGAALHDFYPALWPPVIGFRQYPSIGPCEACGRSIDADSIRLCKIELDAETLDVRVYHARCYGRRH